jgi:hypothetical protein
VIGEVVAESVLLAAPAPLAELVAA